MERETAFWRPQNGRPPSLLLCNDTSLSKAEMIFIDDAAIHSSGCACCKRDLQQWIVCMRTASHWKIQPERDLQPYSASVHCLLSSGKTTTAALLWRSCGTCLFRQPEVTCDGQGMAQIIGHTRLQPNQNLCDSGRFNFADNEELTADRQPLLAQPADPGELTLTEP